MIEALEDLTIDYREVRHLLEVLGVCSGAPSMLVWWAPFWETLTSVFFNFLGFCVLSTSSNRLPQKFA